MVFCRLHPEAEVIGWFQTGVAALIGLYYAVILARAGLYIFKSFNKGWGDTPTSTSPMTSSSPTSSVTAESCRATSSDRFSSP